LKYEIRAHFTPWLHQGMRYFYKSNKIGIHKNGNLHNANKNS
jgi:hypothetical protein